MAKRLRKTRYYGVWTDGRDFFTQALSPRPVYGERMIVYGGRTFRRWSPERSKLAAAMKLGLRNFPFSRSSHILYLGAAQGTTASHLSDIAVEGAIYTVEKSERAMVKLVRVAEDRPNLFPILSDANWPERYSFVPSRVDVIYEDVAQRNQIEIFLKNADHFGCRSGMIMLKTRAISSVKSPREVLSRSTRSLEEAGFEVLEALDLRDVKGGHFAVFVSR